MKTKQTVIAVCITALFASGAVMAKEKWEYNEDKWDDTRSYGRVTIDKDSVSAWGPWEDFVEPAAGAPSVAFAGAGEGNLYRPLPNPIPIPVDDVCRSGDWCGYAIYRNTNNERNGDIQTFGYSPPRPDDPRPYAGIFALTLTPDPNNYYPVTIDGGEGPGQISWRLAALPGNETPIFGASHDPMDAYFRDQRGDNGKYGYSYENWSATTGLHNFYASQDTFDSGILDVSKAEGFPRGYYEGEWRKYYGKWYWVVDFDRRNYLPTNNPEVAVGWFERITSYIYGGNGDYPEMLKSEGGETIQKTHGLYVAGIAAPQAYLDVQRAEGIKARYSGNSAEYNTHNNPDYTHHTVPVTIDVNFGTASWSGSWNNGKDSGVAVQIDSAGNRYLTGEVGFNASGTISGVNIQSTALSATDKQAVVTGTVQGTFFGQTAGSIGGVSDIVKETKYYAPASNVGVFLVDKKIAD